MTRFFVGFALVVAFEATAAAQVDPNSIGVASFDPDNATAPVSAVEGNGIKVGEGTVLRPVFGIETGYVSNVFYVPTDATGVGVLRLLAQIGTSSLSDQRLAEPGGEPGTDVDLGDFQYRVNVRASYDLMLTGNEAVSGTGGLGLGASFHGLANPMGSVSFGMDEDFYRLIRAANFETDANTNRDINNLGLKLVYHPVEHSIGGFLYYQNTIDIFERSQQEFANRMFNRLGLHPTWQWLPRTQVYGDISEAIVTGIGTNNSGAPAKVTSYPFTVLAGLSTLFSIKTTFNIYAGYTNGFYSSGPNFSSPMGGVQLGYRYSPLGRITAGYQLAYEDSVNANFYRDHVLTLNWQQLVDPLVLMLQPEVHFRQYQGIQIVDGPPTRDDLIFAVVAGAHYNFRNWFQATLDYRFADVSTDYRYMRIGGGAVTDPSYVRHEVLLGIRVAM